MPQEAIYSSSRPQELQPIVTDSLDQFGRERVAHFSRDLTLPAYLGEPRGLSRPGSLDAPPDPRRRLAPPIVGELLERDARYFDVNIDAIQERP